MDNLIIYDSVTGQSSSPISNSFLKTAVFKLPYIVYRHFQSEYYSILNTILDNNLNIIPDKITEPHISTISPIAQQKSNTLSKSF